MRKKKVESKLMRCSRYGNVCRMHVRLNGEPSEEVNCFKYLGSQVDRMNEGYRVWGALISVLSNRGFGIKAKKCPYDGVIAPTAL